MSAGALCRAGRLPNCLRLQSSGRAMPARGVSITGGVWCVSIGSGRESHFGCALNRPPYMGGEP